MSAEEEQREVMRLTGEVSEAVFTFFIDEVAYRGLHSGGAKYALEESDDADDPLVLVREKDGERYEVELEVFVHKLAPKPPPPDPDAPVHIEGQEELPLGVGAP